MPDFKHILINRVRLDCCKQHCFNVEGLTVEEIQNGFGVKLECLNCGGEMSLLEINQYIRGFAAAGGAPCQVWEGWKAPGEEIKTTCPSCFGKTYVEPRPNDYFDCDLCECAGYVTLTKAAKFLKERNEC